MYFFKNKEKLKSSRTWGSFVTFSGTPYSVFEDSADQTDLQSNLKSTGRNPH